MQLPEPLKNAIEQLLEAANFGELTKAREQLTQRYRQSTNIQFITDDAQRLSYLVSRLPATYAALMSALKQIKEVKSLPIKSMLDLGAGPGTGAWAACESFPEIESITLLEKDSSLASIGKKLADLSGQPSLKQAIWKIEDLEKIDALPSHDLVLLSYSIGELNPNKIKKLIDNSWQAANQLLLIVEPGTPVGFERIRLIRQHLIGQGAYLIAPCPHHLACPMSGGDWCHFSARIERTSLHRRLKGGTLGYEDEKFSYIAAVKSACELPASRILSQPLRRSGHVVLKLCTPEGVQTPTISKKKVDLYKKACRADWGDSINY